MSEILSNVELRNKIVSLSGYRSDLPKDYELGFIDCRSKVLEIIEKYGYDNVVCVPQYVAVWFEENKHALDLAIFTKIRELDDTRYPHETDFENWLDNAENNPIETLIHMKDSYEVEKEPLYEVIIGDLYLIKKFNNRNDFYFDTNCSLCAWEKSAYQLTEAEIKAIDERYWPFAVPVEKV